MTAFVESCVETVADSAVAAERQARGRPRASRLLRLLEGKRNILVTTHQHPDPDALASSLALCTLLNQKLPGARAVMSIKGRIGGGINEVFTKHSSLSLVPWDDAALASYDAIILLDTQPHFAFSPLPPTVKPFAVIDHHRGRKGMSLKCPFCDVRTDAGATASIIFSYFMELEAPIRPDLGATLLYGIETDLAGAAGTPGELDNIALSSLTLIADPRKLYQMRYVDLGQSHYVAFSEGLSNAVWYESSLGTANSPIVSHLEAIDSLEKPALVADFLLRFEKVQWALVTAVSDNKLMTSIRTSSKASAADMARRVFRKIGDGGGHRTKAGGFVTLPTGSPEEVTRYRTMIRRRFLRALGVTNMRGQRLIPRAEKAEPAKAS